MNWTAIGAIFMAFGVALGAFGAHGLKDHLDEYRMSVYEKAVFYHFVHALGLLLLGLFSKTSVVTIPGANRVGWLLSAGIILFSGSLYALAITKARILGAVTPFGGLAFIAAWAMFALEAIRSQG